MLTCIAVLLICYIQIKEIYLFSFKKFVCIIKFHIFVELKILFLKSASNLNGNLNCSKELEHYAS